MKKLMSFFILVIITTLFVSGCVSNYPITGNEQKADINMDEILFADMGKLKIGFPRYMVDWMIKNQTERIIGIKNKKGSRIWSWKYRYEYNRYMMDLVERTNKGPLSKEEKSDFSSNFDDIYNIHINFIKFRYKNYQKGDVIATVLETKAVSGEIVPGVPYKGYSSVIKYSKLYTTERMTEVHFENFAGNMCKLYLLDMNIKRPVDLLEITKVYAREDLN